MKRLTRVLALLLLSARAGFGQEMEGGTPAFVRVGDVEAESARLLKSDVSAERAWGAYLAGQHGLKTQTSALVALLQDPTLGGSWEHGLVRQAALDALIRLDARVPPEALRALAGGNSVDEALVLMASAPEENAGALLEVMAARDAFEGQADARWLAAGNMLAAMKARGLAAQLLKGLKVEASVVVQDADGNYGFGFGGGGGGCGCGGWYEPPAGFPPVGFYGLTKEPARGAVVLAPGRHTVYYVRLPRPAGGECYDASPVRDVVRVEYLAALLDAGEEELDIDARPSLTVVCREGRQCRRELASARDRLVQAYRNVAGKLAEKGLLDGDVPPAPDLTFTLKDERRHKTFPLPATLRGVRILHEDTPTGDAN